MLTFKTRIGNAHSLLSPYAVPLKGLLGRTHLEEFDETRFPFQRDRDRIIHTQAFRRLQGKTQVFVTGSGDHYRTRLTHTMEVAQISRDMARTLGLNEDLAECIALAHDLGHPPFGHMGETAMNEEMQHHNLTFEHNLQSLRLVTVLEERTTKYAGLNLNQEVLEGLMKHRTTFDTEHGQELPRSPSLEAQVVNLADEIAYTAHDTDDGLNEEIIFEKDLLGIPLFAHAHARASERGTEVRGSLIHLLVSDVYQETEKRLAEQQIQSLEDVYTSKEALVSFSNKMQEELKKLRQFLWDHLYLSPEVREPSKHGMDVIKTLFHLYEAHPPKKILGLQKRTESSLPEAIKDYIAGMTDAYAEKQVS